MYGRSGQTFVTAGFTNCAAGWTNGACGCEDGEAVSLCDAPNHTFAAREFANAAMRCATDMPKRATGSAETAFGKMVSVNGSAVL